MITKLDASGWEYGNATKPMELLYTLTPGSIVEVAYRGPHSGTLWAVTADGERMYLSQGCEIAYRGRLDGFAGLCINVEGDYAVRASYRDASERLDPTIMVHQPVEVINPEKVALRSMLQDYLNKAKIAGMFDTPEKAQKEFEELADDIANGDLEFDDPDPFSLTAAAEQEEERIAEAHLAKMEEERRLRDELELARPNDPDMIDPPGEPKTAPVGAVAAEATKAG